MNKRFILRQDSGTIRMILVILFFVMFNKDLGAISLIYWPVILGCSGLLLFLSGGIKKIRISRFLFWYMLFVLFSAFSYIWAIDDLFVVAAVKSMIINTIIMLAIDNSIRTYEDILAVMEATIIASLLVSLYLFISIDWIELGQNKLDMEVTGQNWNVNEIGLMAMWAISLYLIHPNKKLNLRSWMLFLIPNVTILMFSGSRKAWLSIVLVLILYLFVNNQKKILKNIFVTVCILTISIYLVMNVPILYEIGGHRFESMLADLLGRGEVDSSTLLRQYYIAFGWEKFLDHPIFGYGLDCFRKLLSSSYMKKETYSHNNYIELLVNGGITIAAVFYSIYISGLTRGFRWMKKCKFNAPAYQVKMVLYFMGLLVLQLGLQIGMVMYQDLIMLIVLMLYGKLLYVRGEM